MGPPSSNAAVLNHAPRGSRNRDRTQDNSRPLGVRSRMADTFLGCFILILALILWRVTHSPWGWGVLFIAGSYFVLTGLYQILRGRD